MRREFQTCLPAIRLAIDNGWEVSANRFSSSDRQYMVLRLLCTQNDAAKGGIYDTMLALHPGRSSKAAFADGSMRTMPRTAKQHEQKGG